MEGVCAALEDGKAEDIVTINLEGKTPIADAMIVASGNSARQVLALADRVQSVLEALGVKSPRIEGKSIGDWVLIDAGDILIHLFRPEVRSYYALEKLWDPEAYGLHQKPVDRD